MHPYLIPLFDALSDMVTMQKRNELLRDGIIEIIPLEFMRGRTLDNTFVILDEAQNATPKQMKMFLTRKGFNSTFVVNGDVTQSDIEGSSGLYDAQQRLQNVEGINWVTLTTSDIVRDPIVQKIVNAYERKF
jgi:phosphate starvation-inducible PhoH-like protein